MQLESSDGSDRRHIATGSTSQRINKGAVLDDTLSINPTTVFNARFAWPRFEEPAIESKSVGYDVASLGFSPSFISQIAVPHILGISFTGYSGFGGRQPESPTRTFQPRQHRSTKCSAHTLRRYRMGNTGPNCSGCTDLYSRDDRSSGAAMRSHTSASLPADVSL